MKLKAYPEYKSDSKTWSASLPSHWRPLRLKWTLEEIDERAGNKALQLLGLSKQLGVVTRDKIEQSVSESNDYGKYKIARAGDIVMNKMQAWNGVFGISPQDGIVSPDYSVFRCKERPLTQFFSLLFRTNLAAGEFFKKCRGMGTAFLRLNSGDFLDSWIAVPPPGEERKILSFLDRETAKIDALIAEQQRLIELLQEKRQAVISHAVTNGLNPNAPMKDSGVEWLGEVPEHWEIKPLKHLCEIYSGFPFKSDLFQVDGIPVVRMSNISEGAIDLQDAVCVPEPEVPPEALIESGDLLLGLSGSVGNFGIAAESDLPAAVNQRVARIRTCHPILKHFLSSSLYSEQVTCGLPSTTIANVSASQLGNCLLALPPLKEQEQIEIFLHDFRISLDELQASTESSIELLQERRSALISAAVTGQIDVRGLVPEAAEQ